MLCKFKNKNYKLYDIFIVEGRIVMKKIMKYIDKPLLIVTVLLFAIGLIMVFSASNVTAYMAHVVSPYYYFIKQGIFLIGGIIIAFIIIRFSEKAYGKLSKALLLFIIIALVGLPFFGVEINNAKSWYDLKFMSFQPSEFAKVITIVWMATYYEKNKKNLDKIGTCLIPLGIAFLIAYLIFQQPDLGTTIIYCAIVASIFFVAPIKKEIKNKIFLSIGGLVVLGAFVLFGTNKTLLLDRQLERITDFRNPCDKLLSSGNQVCNTYIAINNGGLTGEGLGNSTQKYLYLPEPYTDFIFAIIVEELGLIVGLLIIFAYIFVLYRILVIGRKSFTDKGAMICFGIAFYIFLHIAINLLGLFGLIPMTGVPLPFMSYGGSYTICLIAALTIVQRISVENGLNKEKVEQKIRAKK